jgi:hypothetical protein
MNILDFKDEGLELPPGDKLELVFACQRELAEKYHKIEEENAGHSLPRYDQVDINSYQGQARIKDFAWRVTEEIAEAMLTLKNRPWKQTSQVTDEDHYREEMIDAFHFFIELLIMSGFTADSLAKYYLMKHSVNQFRIKSQY